MNTILFRGKHLKVVHYTGRLYRADCETFSEGLSASQDYRGAPMKYFTLEKQETYAYSRRGYPFIKTWRTERQLILIDIFDVPTRNALKELIGSGAINTAFPLHEKGFVYRVSEENTKNKDDDVLRSICEQGVFDGYYMRRQLSRGNGLVSSFHSEVGLCPGAFGKLVLEQVEKDREAPPCIKKKVGAPVKTRRSRFFRNNNNNNKSNKNNNTNKNNKSNKNNNKNKGNNIRGTTGKNNTRKNNINKHYNISSPPRKRARLSFGNAIPKFSLLSMSD